MVETEAVYQNLPPRQPRMRSLSQSAVFENRGAHQSKAPSSKFKVL